MASYLQTFYPGEISADATGRFVAPEYDMTRDQFDAAKRQIESELEEAKADAETEMEEELPNGISFNIDDYVVPAETISVRVLDTDGRIYTDHLIIYELDLPDPDDENTLEPTNTKWVWHTDGGDGTCEKCDGLDGAEFENKEDVPEFPVHPNCKCWVEEVEIDEDGNEINRTRIAGNNILPPLTEEKLKTDEELKNKGENMKDIAPEKHDPKLDIFTDKLKENMIEHEGAKLSPYIDSKGYLTIGIGNNVNNLRNFLALDLTNMKTGEKLTTSEKTALHGQILSKISSKTFDYKDYKDIQIPKIEMYEKFDSQLDKSYKELERKFSDFTTFPISVQQALLDMQFNIGDAGFQAKSNTIGGRVYSGWPRLFEAVRNQDWATAARESNRIDVQSSRNSWTREKFMLGYSE